MVKNFVSSNDKRNLVTQNIDHLFSTYCMCDQAHFLIFYAVPKTRVTPYDGQKYCKKAKRSKLEEDWVQYRSLIKLIMKTLRKECFKDVSEEAKKTEEGMEGAEQAAWEREKKED